MACDRAKASVEWARQGAPEATQVADRFHLLQQLVEALEHVFPTHRTALEAVEDVRRRQGVPWPDGTVAAASPHAPRRPWQGSTPGITEARQGPGCGMADQHKVLEADVVHAAEACVSCSHQTPPKLAKSLWDACSHS
jgi:hypothetical protein